MVQRIGGKRRKSRYKMKKSADEKGKISITKYLQTFKEGEKVQLKADPFIQKGIYHLDFHGKNGIVSGKQGKCYKVTIKDRKKNKVILVHPVHLKKMK